MFRFWRGESRRADILSIQRLRDPFYCESPPQLTMERESLLL